MLREKGRVISPGKLKLLLWCPPWFAAAVLPHIYRSRFGTIFICRHAVKAKHETDTLHREFYGFLNDSDSGGRVNPRFRLFTFQRARMGHGASGILGITMPGALGLEIIYKNKAIQPELDRLPMAHSVGIFSFSASGMPAEKVTV